MSYLLCIQTMIVSSSAGKDRQFNRTKVILNTRMPYVTKMVALAMQGASVHNGQRDRVSVLS